MAKCFLYQDCNKNDQAAFTSWLGGFSRVGGVKRGNGKEAKETMYWEAGGQEKKKASTKRPVPKRLFK